MFQSPQATSVVAVLTTAASCVVIAAAIFLLAARTTLVGLTVQSTCTDYVGWVLDQHANHIPADRIEALWSRHIGDHVPAGVRADRCGTIQSIIATAGGQR